MLPQLEVSLYIDSNQYGAFDFDHDLDFDFFTWIITLAPIMNKILSSNWGITLHLALHLNVCLHLTLPIILTLPFTSTLILTLTLIYNIDLKLGLDCVYTLF